MNFFAFYGLWNLSLFALTTTTITYINKTIFLVLIPQRTDFAKVSGDCITFLFKISNSGLQFMKTDSIRSRKPAPRPIASWRPPCTQEGSGGSTEDVIHPTIKELTRYHEIITGPFLLWSKFHPKSRLFPWRERQSSRLVPILYSLCRL